MKFIVLISVIGIVLLQASGAIAPSSVGGPLTIALAVFAGVLAVAIHEAWTQKRGVPGWIVNILVAFAGALVAAPLAGMIFEQLLSSFASGSGSLAAAGGPVFSIALAATMVFTLMAAWAALWLVNRLRSRQRSVE